LGGLGALLPDIEPDPARALASAQEAVDRVPRDYTRLCALGGAIYRAGRFEEAVQRLEEAAGVPPPGGSALHPFWLAMCHARLGHAEEAQQWLDKGDRWLEQALQRQPGDAASGLLPWGQRVSLQLLRREAEALIGPPLSR
jgi:Flp pilus assembly protein TadD